MAELTKDVHIVLLPFPGLGHLLPLLDLACLLSARSGLALTIVVTPANLPLLSPLLACAPAIQTLVLPFSGVESSKGLPLPAIRTLFHDLAGLREPLLRWARAHPRPPSAIIADFCCGWAHQVAADLSIPHLVFCPSGAFTLSIFHSVWRRMPKRSEPDELLRFDDLPGAPVFPWRQLPYIYRSYQEGEPVSEFIKDTFVANTKSWGFVFNSFHELESVYLDHLRADLGHARVWAVGPLAQPEATAGRGGQSSISDEELMSWLDDREAGSVVYVCFGTQVGLLPKQAAALAAGLERSGQRFLWCAGEKTPVPEGFDERVAGRGWVIRGWAPQVAILSHEAVGCFVTHCGWNSVMEAAAAGVVPLTWPMVGDQFFTARLVVEELRFGAKASDGGAELVPDPDELARVINQSVGEGGSEKRARAKEIGEMARESVRMGGRSYLDLERMIDELKKFKSN